METRGTNYFNIKTSSFKCEKKRPLGVAPHFSTYRAKNTLTLYVKIMKVEG